MSCDEKPSTRALFWSIASRITLVGSSQSNCTLSVLGSARITAATSRAIARTFADVLAGDAELHREADRRAVLEPRHAPAQRREVARRSSVEQPRAHALALGVARRDARRTARSSTAAAAGRAAGRSAGCRCRRRRRSSRCRARGRGSPPAASPRRAWPRTSCPRAGAGRRAARAATTPERTAAARSGTARATPRTPPASRRSRRRGGRRTSRPARGSGGRTACR